MNDNMQDILKSYYASGGKTLFENQTLLEYNQDITEAEEWRTHSDLVGIIYNHTGDLQLARKFHNMQDEYISQDDAQSSGLTGFGQDPFDYDREAVNRLLKQHRVPVSVLKMKQDAQYNTLYSILQSAPELTEQIFRRAGRMYFTTRHADQRRKDRGITDSKVETAISMLEQDLDWLIYMGMQGFRQGQGLSIFDPKSNLTLVVTYKRAPLDPVTKTPVEVDPDQPEAISIMTIYHGSPITSNRIPKLLKRNGFTDKLGDPVELKTDNVKKRSEYTGPKQFFHLQKGITRS